MSTTPESVADAQPEIPVHHQSVDARGLACPLPILRAKKALATMASGEVLQVLTTDRGALRDFQAFCRQTGNALLSQVEGGEYVQHYLCRR